MKKLIEDLIEKWERDELYHKGRHDGALLLTNDALMGNSYQGVVSLEEGCIKTAGEIISDLKRLLEAIR